MRRSLHDTGELIQFNGRNLLLFLAVYRLTAASAYVQLLDAGMRFSLGRAEYSYLTLENAGRVLACPWTVPVVLALLGVGLGLIMVEAGGLTSACSRAVYSLKMPAWRIFLEGIRSTKEQLERRNFRLFAVAAADFFLMNLAYLYRTLTHIKPVNFVIEEMSGNPFLKAGAFLFVCVCVLGVIPAYFVFHGCMVEQRVYRDSRRDSAELLRGRRARIVARVVIPQVLIMAAALACYLAMVFVMAGVTVVFVRRDLQFSFLIQASQWAERIIMFLASGAASLFYFADLTVQYYRYGKNQVGRRHFFDTGTAFFGRKNGLAFLSIAGIMTGMGMVDGAVNGTFLASSVVVRTEITAHRGSSLSAPENTMAALLAAVEEMADWAEIDVQETMDGVAVVCHDENLRRIAGVNRNIKDMTFQELLNVDAGSWFSGEYEGERIPSLEEVMEYAKGRLNLNIEIKYVGADSGLPEKVCRLVEAYEMEDQCIITCTSMAYLRQIKERNPQIRTGYIIPAAYGAYYRNDDIDIISIRSGFVSKKLVRLAHQEGKSVHAWTVNDKAELERMRVLAVDNVITDDPLLAREILYRGEGTESLLEYLRELLR